MTDKDKNIGGHMKPFGFLKRNMAENRNILPPENTYFKADGTKVTEKKDENGTSVIETCPDGTVIARFYYIKEVLRQDYIRRFKVELVHHYDELGVMTDELMNVYDNDLKMVKQTEKVYEYYDNGQKSLEEILDSPDDIKTTIKYNEKGEQIEKTVQRGTMKTWYDLNDKPIKREINRGSGGVITEDLTDK